jgi:dihydropteroate synthase
MGILNVTPDSFSDAGKFFDPQRAIDHGLELVAAGADLIDIGGESTRPYSQRVEVDEELRRVVPVVTALAIQVETPLSIDTYKAAVARECLAAGAEVINDVTALTDPAMLAVAVESGAGVCAMHMQGTPQTMQDNPTYTDVVEEVLEYLRARRDEFEAAGILQDCIALDPGVGFGKTHEHNLALLAACYRFQELGCPVLVGPSRKGFIAHVLGDKQVDRAAGTVGVCLALARQGVQILRVHDVRDVRQALQLFEASGGNGPASSAREPG